MHIDSNAFIAWLNEMVHSGSGDFYAGYFCGLASTLAMLSLCCILFATGCLIRYVAKYFLQKCKDR